MGGAAPHPFFNPWGRDCVSPFVITSAALNSSIISTMMMMMMTFITIDYNDKAKQTNIGHKF